MPFTILRDDITHVKADALVNAANERLQMGGGVCGALFRAAGPRELQEACDAIGHCPCGQAVATPAFRLPARYVIHAVGPIWQGGGHGERELLAGCYRTALERAGELRCTSIAFPLISAGIYGYPRREALQVARETILAYLADHEMDVKLVLFERSAVQLADDLRLRVESYIDDVYVWASDYQRRSQAERSWLPRRDSARSTGAWEEESYDASPLQDADAEAAFSGSAPSMPCPPPNASAPMAAPAPGAAMAGPAAPADASARKRRIELPQPLRRLLSHLDAGFSPTLLALIDERGMSDAQVYKRANLSRQHFSKIRSNPAYRPKKNTVLALAIALELPLDETKMLLERAGYALSHADERDVIVEFFIREHNYDVFQINETLFAFDQPLLG